MSAAMMKTQAYTYMSFGDGHTFSGSNKQEYDDITQTHKQIAAVPIDTHKNENTHVFIRMCAQVSMSLSVSEADFYLVKDSFISNVASFLGINPRNIHIVDIVPGNARRLLDDAPGPKKADRALLGDSVSVSFEVVPEATLSLADVVVLEDQATAIITIARSSNVSMLMTL